MPRADLVLEGGGVKGLGLVGAVLALMRAGYEFPRAAGTSAGAIVAAFLAAGVTADALAGIMERLDYSRVPDRAGVPVPSRSSARASGCCATRAPTPATTSTTSCRRSSSGSACGRSTTCTTPIAGPTGAGPRSGPTG